MAPASNEDQFMFLISCIRYSNNGKVDFEEVRKECKIVSKGAAAKRYERMMKAHGIHQSQTSTIDTIRNATIPTKRKSSHTVSKKRKLAQYSETNANTDDDEGPLHVKAEGGDCKFKIKPVKCEKVKRVPIKCERVKSEQLKEEPSVKEETDERVKEEPKIKVDGSAPTVVKTETEIGIPQLEGTDENLFKDFLAFGAYAIPEVAPKIRFDEVWDQKVSSELQKSRPNACRQSYQDSILIGD